MAIYVNNITFITHKNDIIIIVKLLFVARGSVKFDNEIMTSFLCVINVIHIFAE